MRLVPIGAFVLLFASLAALVSSGQSGHLLEKSWSSAVNVLPNDSRPTSCCSPWLSKTSAHFPFARKGVPSVNAGGGIDYIGRPAGYGKRVLEDYIRNDYHKPSDAVKPDWDMSGAVQDLQYYWKVGYLVAQADKFPEWKPGAEFKAKRDAMLKK